jgi:hypothetical protein
MVRNLILVQVEEILLHLVIQL